MAGVEVRGQSLTWSCVGGVEGVSSFAANTCLGTVRPAGPSNRGWSKEARMSAGEQRVGSSARTMAARYAPFLAIVALQLVLVTITPKHTSTVTTTASAGQESQVQTATGAQQTGEVTPSGNNQATVTTQPGAVPSSGGGAPPGRAAGA